MKSLRKALSVSRVTAALVLFAMLVADFPLYFAIPAASAQTFTGPGTCAAGQCQGALGVNSSGNIGVGAGASSTARFYSYSTTSNVYAVAASGTVYSFGVGGGFKFPDGTTQTTAATVVSTLSAANISSGQFGLNTGGGLYAFPSGIGINGATAVATEGVVISGTLQRGVDAQITGTGAANYGVIGSTAGAGTANYGGYFSATAGTGNNYSIYIPGNPSAAAGNYAIYSSSPAQSYFAGNVGIGTASPGFKLHVVGASNFAMLENTDTSVNAYAQLGIRAGSATSYLWTANQNSTAWGGANSLNIYAGTGGAMTFWTNATQKVIIDTSGNVGIGTAAPAQRLTVGAPGNAANAFYDIGANTIGAGSSIYSYGYVCAGNASGACTAGGGVVMSTTSIKFPDGTIQTTAAGSANISAANVSSGSFGSNTGGGNYTFPAQLNVGGQGRFAGWYAAGTGLAAEIGVSGGAGYVMAYDRSLASYATLYLQAGGALVTLNPTTNNIALSGSNTNSQVKIANSGSADTISFLNYAADNKMIGFDVDYASGWVARNATVAALYKGGGTFYIGGSAGNTVGGVAAIPALMTINLSGGATTFASGVTAASFTTGGTYNRSAAGTGYLNGGYASVETSGTTGPIYAIGPGYAPTATTLGTMYGIGYGYTGLAALQGSGVPVNQWGMYVAGAGSAGIFLSTTNNTIYAAGGTFSSAVSAPTVTGNTSVTGTEVYATNWLRNNTAGTGLYNQVNGYHWYSDGTYWTSTAPNGILLRTGYGGAARGYVYTDGTNFGLLGSNGSWAVEVSGATSNVIIPNGTLSMASHQINNLATPTASTDAATKGYVDTAGSIQFMGYSAATTGAMGGIVGANAKCNAAYAGSHMCTQGEIIRSGVTSMPNPGASYAWIACDLNHGTTCDGPTYSMDVGVNNDATCGQWTQAVGAAYSGSAIYYFYGSATMLACSNSLPIACCK